jgi:hypothetical protein
MPDSGFIQVQKSFTAHVRNPRVNPIPDGIEARRMKIYSDLLYNNVQSLLSSTFPVIHKILSAADWTALTRDYFAQHQAHTPLFPQMPREFLRYLQDERGQRDEDPAFLLELAHYEWTELALSIDTREIPCAGIDKQGDLLQGCPQFSPLAWPLAYQFPVQRLSPDYQPATAPEQATYLLVYRNRQDSVGFLELNPVSARLVDLLNNNAAQLSGDALLQQIATELQHPNPDAVRQGGLQIMQDLLNRDVILGTKKPLA